MILFLNFAPISFMGGAEKWMNDTAKKVDQKEETALVSVAGNIASVYSSLVLKRKFDSRANNKDIHRHISLDATSFIPFTSKWSKARKLFAEARLVYSRYELPEFAILFYFSGISGIRKTIAGLHSPFLYSEPETFFEKLHNSVYSSMISKKVLSSVKKVHVLNKRDFELFSQDFKFKNVEYIPNGMATQKNVTKVQPDDKLHILYVGELSKRKGIDRVIDVIQNSPKNFVFTIAGDGPYKNSIQELANQNENCVYKGFLNQFDLSQLYKSNEVLFLPSRAESMPLSILEALSYGLVIVDSQETSLALEENTEYISRENTPESYITIFKQIIKTKQTKKLNPQRSKNYFDRNFSSQKIDSLLFSNFFNTNI